MSLFAGLRLLKSESCRTLFNRIRTINVSCISKYANCSPCPPCDGNPPVNPPRHHITYKPYVQPCYKDHDHKNMTLKRPMSPHLTIYAPTLTAMTSILQRITGAFLCLEALALSLGALCLPNGIDSFVSAIQSLHLDDTQILIIKFIIGLPFAYHVFIGLRFIIWNSGRMLTLKGIYTSAYVSIMCALAMAAGFAFLPDDIMDEPAPPPKPKK